MKKKDMVTNSTVGNCQTPNHRGWGREWGKKQINLRNADSCYKERVANPSPNLRYRLVQEPIFNFGL